MLKSLAIFSILLATISCRFADKECHNEFERKLKNCEGRFMSKILKARATNSTVSPVDFEARAADFKNMLKCIGNLKCRGAGKLIKFQLDTLDFYTDQVFEADDCLTKADQGLPLYHCAHPQDFNFKRNRNFSISIVPCVEQVLEKTDCSVELKVNLERGAYALRDLYAHHERAANDEGYRKNFDLVFDPSKYGL